MREDENGCTICLKTPEIVIQRRVSGIDDRFNKGKQAYWYDGFKTKGDFWLGLDRFQKLTASTEGKYQLVLSAKHQGKWMQIVLDDLILKITKSMLGKLQYMKQQHQI